MEKPDISIIDDKFLAGAKELGLSEEELPFYDFIAHHESAIKGHGRIKVIVHHVVLAVTKNL